MFLILHIYSCAYFVSRINASTLVQVFNNYVYVFYQPQETVSQSRSGYLSLFHSFILFRFASPFLLRNLENTLWFFFLYIWIQLISFGTSNDRQYMYATYDDVATLRICYLTQRKIERSFEKVRWKITTTTTTTTTTTDRKRNIMWHWMIKLLNVWNDVDPITVSPCLSWIEPRIRRERDRKRRSNTHFIFNVLAEVRRLQLWTEGSKRIDFFWTEHKDQSAC